MASLSNKVDVLVTGAGPCGLLTALELKRAGLEVEIIDSAWRASAQSYACGLHGASFALLAELGLDAAVVEDGIRVDTMSFHEGMERRAELHFDALKSSFPGLTVLPQDRLEEILEDALRALGVRVRWGHRLDTLRQADTAVFASVEKLGVTAGGYPVAHEEAMVESATEVRARYVVGADGSSSHVRQILGIPVRRQGTATAYEVFEFEAMDPTAAGREVRVALGPSTLDAFWPQPGSTCRWSLELAGGKEEHPAKERASVVVLNPETDGGERDRAAARIAARAPWYTAGIKEIDWTTVVGFERMVVERFGVDRCWLVGDAGHQTGPVGMQSMNVGLREAVDLARRLTAILRAAGSTELLAAYDRERQAEWALLLGGQGGLRAGPEASPWVRQHRQRLLPCLAASGPQLASLAAQLGLSLP